MGMTGSAWADATWCKNVQNDGKRREGGTYCLSQEYPYTYNTKCKCPNPDYNSYKTQKCKILDAKGIPRMMYHCENPNP